MKVYLKSSSLLPLSSKRALFVLKILFVLFVGGNVGAQSIGINFTEGAGEELAAGESAGVFLQANWNNVVGAADSETNLVDSAGQATTADLTWSSNNVWRIAGTPTDGNSKLMKGYLDQGDNGTGNVSVTSIPFATYDVIVYFDGDQDSSTFGYTVNGTSADPVSENGLSWMDAGGGVFEGAADGTGNYVRFTGLSGDLTLESGANHNRSPINGVQIISSGAAATMGVNFRMNGATNGATIDIANGDTFTDSGGPGTGSTNNYRNNENFTTTFRAPEGHVIQVNFTQFSTEDDEDGDGDPYDYLSLYDGPDTSNLIQTRYGTDTPGEFITTGRTFTARFISDSSIVAQGWQATMTAVPGGVTLRLFDDRFWDGVYNPGVDTGAITGVAIRAFDAIGNSVIATDDGGGLYTIPQGSALVGDKIRVEVDQSTLPAGYFPGIVSPNADATHVPFMFVIDRSAGALDLNIPVQTPKVECLTGSDLDLFTTCFVGGSRTNTNLVNYLSQDNTILQIIPADAGAVVAFPRVASGNAPVAQNRYLATISEVGSTYGLAFQESFSRLYVGAYAKRHSEMGPAGFGAIYVVNSGGGGVVDTIQIPNTTSVAQGVDATGANTQGSDNGWLRDSNMFDAVGKRALGDIDMNDTEDTIWVVNLDDRHLYMADVTDPALPSYKTVTDLGEIAVPVPVGSLASDWRPFALEWHDGELYVGGTWSGESTQSIDDVQFQIFRVSNPKTPGSISYTKVFESGALDYDRTVSEVEWKAWIPAWDVNLFGDYSGFAKIYPQPMLSDFEFDNNNSLILGIRDRFGDQMGIRTQGPGLGTTGDTDAALYETISMGEILHAEFTGASDVTGAVNGDWRLETAAGFTGTLADDPNDFDDPSTTDKALEFYWRTSFTSIHPETAQGGLAFHPDWPDQIATTSQDPFALRSGGVHYFFTKDAPSPDNPDVDGSEGYLSGESPYQGAGNTSDNVNNPAAGGYLIYGGQTGANQPLSLVGKANGLGDLEYACGVTTLQIGDCVWLDENLNGIRDPEETPIIGATVLLYVDFDEDGVFDDLDNNGQPDVVGSTVTDGFGCYYFLARPETSYGIAFDVTTALDFEDSNGVTITTGDLNPTLSDVTGGQANDSNDSDMTTEIRGLPAIAVKTNGIGETDHTSDAGFTTSPLVGLGNLVFIDVNYNGIYDGGIDVAIESLTIELYDAAAGPGIGSPVSSTTSGTGPSAGCYSFTVLPGNYIVHIPESQFAGGSPLEGTLSISGNGTDASAIDDNLTGQDNGVDNSNPTVGGVSSVVITLSAGDEAEGSDESGKDGDGDGDGVDDGDSNFDYTVDFGFELIRRYDLGDLPEGGNKDFPTAGPNPAQRARHLVWSGLTLGSTVDSEDDGQPSIGADGDGADEDGFPLLPSMMPGQTYTVPFTATVPGGLSPVLNAWIDYNCDGMFVAGEQIATDLTVTDGANAVTFTVPVDAVPGTTYSRFRLSTQIGLGAAGDAPDGEVEDYVSRVLRPIGAIGNYVWIDENSDGAQDPGEPGIPNVTVQLKDENGAVIATKQTDSSGGYLFPGLAPGCYYVDILDASILTGYSQTTTFTKVIDGPDADSTTDDGDFGNKDHSGDGYKIDLDPNETNLTADFGYNINPTDDVNNGTNEAAIGDKVWFDTNQNGRLDANEVGIAGVTVELTSAGPDNLFATADDISAAATATTDANGCYLFDGLTPDAYVVTVTDTGNVLAGLTQTGDPDHFGTTGANKDGTTTAPVVLGPGDVFLNADFGYYIDPTTLGRIGDRIWLDEDNSGDGADGVKPVGILEPGIAGVTVALIADINKNGIFDSGEKIIATDLTDADGCYLFEGLPVDADGEGYLVLVNDTNNVLTGLSQTYDEDGGLDNLSGAVLTTAVPESLTEDFSYTPAQAAYGSIGDTVWLDLNNSGGDQSTQGGEPGINNVLVTLKDVNGVTVATTRTNSNGNYLFSNLPFGSYRVEVDTATLPAGLTTTPTYDPEGAADSTSAVTISMAAPNNREQDFSYTPTTPALGSVGDKVWVDATANNTIDGDATQAAGELGLAGVTVTLTPPAGVDAGAGVDVPVTTVTDEKGCYLFTDLPFDDDPYTVTITPPAGFVNDYDLETPGDGTSTVVVNTGSPNPRDQDFSVETTAILYSIGNTIWFDADSDGDRAEDPGNDGTAGTREAPIAGVRVDLCDASGNFLATTTTDATGQYLFSNLPAGTYTVKVDTGTLPDGVSPISTYENDATANSRTTVTIVDADILTEDFSYPLLGAIGDTVFFDGNNNDTPDAGEGLEGVTVTLCDADGNALATTVTDLNGYYYFSGLKADVYTVKVDTATLPAGLVNTEDPDTDPDTLVSPGDSDSEVTIGVGETNLDQDFGYQGEAGRIGNLVWLDLDADGVYDGPGAGETPIGGVTVDLYFDTDGNGTRDPGEPFLGTTTTVDTLDPAAGTDGNYCFENLPAGDYIVEVSDRDGILNGYWHSLGTADLNNNSQEEAFSLELTTGDQKNADFGYYLEPGKLGNFVFLDTNSDGIQDGGEEGLDGVELLLTITYPNGDIIVLKTFTGDDPSTTGVVEKGWYSFCGLLQDEDHNIGSITGSPLFTIEVVTPAGYVSTLADQGSGPTGEFIDSDLSGVTALPRQGSQDVTQQAEPSTELIIASYDFGFIVEPKSAGFLDFLADNAALFGLDDNSIPGVPVIDPLTGLASDPASTDGAIADFGGNPGLTGNVDGDVYNNLLEFALCFDPGSGAKVFPNGDPNPGFHLELNGSSLDAKFNRPANVLAEGELTYTVQISTDGQTWSDFTDISPTIVAGPVNGSETVCYPGLPTATPGLLRLKVSAGTGTAATESVTGPVGWQMATIKDFCQTYADPLLEPCLVTGTITGVSGQVLDLTAAAGTQSLATRLEAGKNYYLEVMNGDNAGHIFDIESFTATSVTLKVDTDLCALQAPYSTKLTVPTDLAGDMFVIREHKTLESLFPIDDVDTVGDIEGFAEGANAMEAGVLIRYDRQGGLETYIASSIAGGADTWMASSTGPGAPDNILPPGEGIFVHNFLGSDEFSILQYGEVRTNQLAVPLCEGYNFVAPAHPLVSQSIDGGDSASRLMNADSTDGKFVFDGSGARSLADQVQFWTDDSTTAATDIHLCYDMIFYLRNSSGTVDQWSVGGTPIPTNEEVKALFEPTRSAMYCIQKDDIPDYYLPSPISNAVN